MNAAAPTPRFAIGPLGYAIEEKAMRDWMARAKAGDRVTYAIGYALPQKAPAVVLARTWSDEQLVQLNFARVDGKFEYYATRRSDPVGADAIVARAKAVSAAMGGNEATARVLRRLRSLAAQTLPCDTNAELARECELPNADAASYQLRKLAGQGAITVEDMGPGERRIVTIVGSGKRTGRGKL